MSEHQFRNTMFGGFNRQDVLDFLTSSAEKNNQELQRQRESYEALEKDLSTAREENAVLRAELSEARQERDELKRRAEQLELDLVKTRSSAAPSSWSWIWSRPAAARSARLRRLPPCVRS